MTFKSLSKERNQFYDKVSVDFEIDSNVTLKEN